MPSRQLFSQRDGTKVTTEEGGERAVVGYSELSGSVILIPGSVILSQRTAIEAPASESELFL
jgi:hypothetical protein